MKLITLFVVFILMISPMVFAVGNIQNTGTTGQGLDVLAREPDLVPGATFVVAASVNGAPTPSRLH